MATKTSLEYVNGSRQWLPPELRDFHDQKDFFKWLDTIVAKRRDDPTNPDHYRDQDLPNWASAHVFTIDYFLWFMAQFGYTLQRSRADVQFCDLDGTVQEHKQKMNEHFHQIIRDELAKNREQNAPHDNQPKD